jgi:hypothetical protein
MPYCLLFKSLHIRSANPSRGAQPRALPVVSSGQTSTNDQNLCKFLIVAIVTLTAFWFFVASAQNGLTTTIGRQHAMTGQINAA